MVNIFDFPDFFGLTYNFILHLNNLNDNCFNYKFFDTGKNPNLYIEAIYDAITTKKPSSEFDVNKFFADFNLNKKREWICSWKLNEKGKGYLMLIIQSTPNSFSLTRNEAFYAPPFLTRGKGFGIIGECHLLGT